MGANWQPIETAPKDGRWILVARDDMQGVVWWNKNSDHWALAPLSYFDRPTHWMPLPQPPQVEKE